MLNVVHSDEKKALVNNLEICYDTFGDQNNEPIILIMGLGGQMIIWEESFCQSLADAGYYVIRFDNRDVGLSSKLDDKPVPDILQLIRDTMEKKQINVPYKLSDMAADTVGLLDQLGINSAHVIGASMGGMIAQTVAIEYPKRVKTLTSISSTTGISILTQTKPEALALLSAPPAKNREEAIDNAIKSWKFLNGSKYPIKEKYYRKLFENEYDRNNYAAGSARQLAAILASGNRNERLKNVEVKTLVIHGDVDPLIHVQGGEETAKVIPNSKLVIIKGMGHIFQEEEASQIISEILNHIK